MKDRVDLIVFVSNIAQSDRFFEAIRKEMVRFDIAAEKLTLMNTT